MGCEGHDWKAYALEELSAAERDSAERHLRGCARCAAELNDIRATLGHLRALPQAELPRRIVFVADEGRDASWWRRMWIASPAWGYASAAILSSTLLSGSILLHGWMMRPVATAAVVDAATVNARIEASAKAQIEARLPQAVDAALKQRLNTELQPALVAARHEIETHAQQASAQSERRLSEQREADLKSVRYAFERLERRINFAMVASTRTQGGGE